MAVSRQNTAITITGNFVYVIGLTFRYYGLGDYAKAIYIRDGSDNLVQGCRFITNDLGVGLKGDAHRNVIQDSEFSDTIAGWTWEDVKAEGNLETGGVRFYSPVDGRGTVIRRNQFHDFFDGLGICPESSAAASNETDFYDNESYDTGDDGVETDGRCVNVRIWGNLIPRHARRDLAGAGRRRPGVLPAQPDLPDGRRHQPSRLHRACLQIQQRRRRFRLHLSFAQHGGRAAARQQRPRHHEPGHVAAALRAQQRIRRHSPRLGERQRYPADGHGLRRPVAERQ